jgi:hypothetical protein
MNFKLLNKMNFILHNIQNMLLINGLNFVLNQKNVILNYCYFTNKLGRLQNEM